MQAVSDFSEYLAENTADSRSSRVPLAATLRFLCELLGTAVSARDIAGVCEKIGNGAVTDTLPKFGSELGLQIQTIKKPRSRLQQADLPILVESENHGFQIITAFTADGKCVVVSTENEGRTGLVTLKEMLADNRNFWSVSSLQEKETVAESPEYYKVGDLIRNHFKEHRGTVLTIMLAALVTNTLSLAGIVFSMQVYDRVVPAASFPTLYVLFAGVLIAILFDFLIKVLRVRLSDIFGRVLDAQTTDTAFKKVLGTPYQDLPQSPNHLVNRIRDVDQIREMVGASTINVISDIPFFMLFMLVLWSISGSLALVPLVSVIFIIVPGLLMQRRLRDYSQEMMKDAAERSAFLVESMGSVLDIKLSQAEASYNAQWKNVSDKSTVSSINFRQLVTMLGTWTSTVQTSVFALVVLFGAPMVINGELSTGALVASSILASRMLSPMGSINQVLSRWQLAKGGASSYEAISAMETETGSESGKVDLPELVGDISLNRAEFKYSENDPVSLYIEKLSIKPGERIAVMGRSGSGKSTLLLALAGLLPATSGEISFDGVRLSSLRSATLRSSIGLVSQNSTLFKGSIRDNILMGDTGFSDADILDAMSACGTLPIISRFEKGLDHRVSERGAGLSDGQKKMVIMARAALRDPRVILLDEPLAHLDETIEKNVLDWLASLDKDRTVIVTSHKASVLRVVDRVIIINDGRLIIDENKHSAISKIRQVRTNANKHLK